MNKLIDGQAAINVLCDNCDNVQSVCPHYPCKQYTAIEALSLAQPEHDENDLDFVQPHKRIPVQLVVSSDCISREAAIDALKNRWKKTRNYEGNGDDIAEECELYLKQVPSAQPDLSGYSSRLWKAAYERGKAEVQADIIVCADCKHWICHDRRCGYWNHGVKALDWCCHAERRTE